MFILMKNYFVSSKLEMKIINARRFVGEYLYISRFCYSQLYLVIYDKCDSTVNVKDGFGNMMKPPENSGQWDAVYTNASLPGGQNLYHNHTFPF